MFLSNIRLFVSREEAESVEEEDEVEQEPSHDNNEITQPGSSPGETDPDQKEKGSSETNHSTETNITSSSDTTESGREALNPADLQEIRSNLQDAAREASDLLRDVQY